MTAKTELTDVVTMIQPAEALDLVLQNVPQSVIENIAPEDGLNRALAQIIHSDQDYPAFDRSMMDGFAVRLADSGKPVECIGELAAGMHADLILKDGQCVQIMTGAPCPQGTEVVVPKEKIEWQGRQVLLPGDLLLDKHIARKGTECSANAKVLKPGDIVSPLALANIVSFGYQKIDVYRIPTAAILTTGSELVPSGQSLKPGQIRDSNGPMFSALSQQLGLNIPSRHLVSDDIESLKESINNALKQADLILISGGVSVGNYDYVPQVILDIGAEIIFHKVKQRPGKPILFARKEDKLIFGLPGNPLSGLWGFHGYVKPAIKKWMGIDPSPKRSNGNLTDEIKNKGPRKRFVLAIATEKDNDPFSWNVTPLPGHGSADIYSPANANCYISIGPGDVKMDKKSPIEFEWIM